MTITAVRDSEVVQQVTVAIRERFRVDVPAGEYELRVVAGGRTCTRPVKVNEGAMQWVQLTPFDAECTDG